MHTFQPIDVNDFAESPFYILDANGMLITAASDGKVNAATSHWGGFGVMWEMAATFVVLRDDRYTRELVDASGVYSLSFLNPKTYHATMKYMEQVSGRDEDKIAGSRLTVDYAMDIPYIDEADQVILCKTMLAQNLQEDRIILPEIKRHFGNQDEKHSLYIGEVLKVMVR